MRRRLRKFLPIVLTALMVQILAPVAACWAASIATSEPLPSGVICHDSAGTGAGPNGDSGQAGAHDGCCSACRVAHAGTAIEPALVAGAKPIVQYDHVVWLDREPDRFGSRSGSLAQARGPPRWM